MLLGTVKTVVFMSSVLLFNSANAHVYSVTEGDVYHFLRHRSQYLMEIVCLCR